MRVKHPIILASASRARQDMLSNVGIEFDAIPADIDEAALLRGLEDNNEPPDEIALKLAREKASQVSTENPNAIVIGSDQVLVFKNQIFQKAKTADEAREKLKALRGQTHHLISAVSVFQGAKLLWEHADKAALTMHEFDDAFLEHYITLAKGDILNCVGGYAFEKHGALLFDKIDADFFTILGMPLLPLLRFLRQEV